MRIIVEKNKTKIITKDYQGEVQEEVLVLGYEDIRKYGFQVVDHMTENIVPKIKTSEEVFLEGDSLEAKMIARKIEDKIKRDVIILDKN